MYGRLQQLGPALIDDQPAEMIARQARGRIYEQPGDRESLRIEAAAMGRALYSGSFQIDRATPMRREQSRVERMQV